MKKIIFLVLVTLLFLLVGCGEKITEATIEDSNEDGVFHIDSSSGLLGVVDLFVMPKTIQGVAISLYNGPASNIGYDIFERDNPSAKIFADSYISTGDISSQAGTQWTFDRWYTIRLVVYESGLAGWIVSFLQSLGLDFFDSLADYMIDDIYEVDLYLSSNQENIRISNWRNVTDQHKSESKIKTFEDFLKEVQRVKSLNQ